MLASVRYIDELVKRGGGPAFRQTQLDGRLDGYPILGTVGAFLVKGVIAKPPQQSDPSPRSPNQDQPSGKAAY
jgi:hypothetical protein